MNKNLNISCVIITFNEENNIDKSIKSVLNLCNEIIIVDSFSTDKTIEICKKYNNVKVFLRHFDNFINQKNYANSLASGDYILSLDADEELIFNRDIILNEIENYTFIKFRRLNFINNSPIKYGNWVPDIKIRLWKRNSAIWSGKTPHEKLIFDTIIKTHLSKAILNHYAYTSLEQLKFKSNKYAKLSIEELKKKPYSYLIFKLLFSPFFKFIKGYFFKFGFLNDKYGFDIEKILLKETFFKYFYSLKSKYNDN